MNMKKKDDMQSRIIKRQKEEIARLKDEIASLQYELQMKDEEMESFYEARQEIKNITNNISAYRDEYADMVKNFREMKSIFSKDVFVNGWRLKLIKILMK